MGAGTFYMVQERLDDFRDMISFLGNTEEGLNSPDGMSVFGFGREQGASPLLSGSQSFVIGLYPERIVDGQGHEKLATYIESRFLKVRKTR